MRSSRSFSSLEITVFRFVEVVVREKTAGTADRCASILEAVVCKDLEWATVLRTEIGLP